MGRAALMVVPPSKSHVQRLVRSAIASGQLSRPDRCSRCDKEGLVDAHHDDYSKPAEVIWVCRRCHRGLHTEGCNKPVHGYFSSSEIRRLQAARRALEARWGERVSLSSIVRRSVLRTVGELEQAK